MGFAQGVSGLNSSAANLDVIGNNIANSGTIGFKSGSVQFSDVYAGSQIGLGTQVASLSQNFAAGTIQTSTQPLDVAITDGDGFFRLTSPGGEVAYSRNGQFTMDKNGFLVNSAGMQLTGFAVSANGTIAGGSPTALQLPTGAMTPNATSLITAQYNIDSRSVIPARTPFDSTDSTTYNYSNSATIYDSLGNSHELSTFFVKTGPAVPTVPPTSTWDVYSTVDGAASSNIGSLVFDSAGKMTTPATGILPSGVVPLTNGAADLSFNIDLTGTTQFGSDNDVKKLTQDGFASGVITSYAINKDGTVIGKYSNEQTKTLGQIVLSSFVNPNGLQSKGNNVWAETAASGAPLTGVPGAGTKRGALTSGALEASNVDLTSELVNLIIAQRTYQANSQTVKTQDQVMQTLINIG